MTKQKAQNESWAPLRAAASIEIIKCQNGALAKRVVWIVRLFGSGIFGGNENDFS